ncbi:MAG: RHS repeat-associated core domain-containing protein [Desulfosalsimonadaceae bacterium]
MCVVISGYRYYSAELGRWLNRDPIGEDGGFNLYLFCKNNSIRFLDKLGLLTEMTNEELDNVYINGDMNFYEAELTPLDIVRMLYSIPFDFFSGDFFRGKIEDSYSNSGCEFLLTVTGMMTDREGNIDFNNKAMNQIEKFRNIDSNLVYNPTRAFVLGDIIQAIGNELGSIDTIARRVKDKVVNAANAAQDNHCGGCYKIYIIAHSQGTMAVKRALSIIPTEVKENIEFWGVGGQIAITDPDVTTHNYANTKDPIPLSNYLPTRLIDNFGWELDKFETNINHFSIDAHDAGKYLDFLEENIQ